MVQHKSSLPLPPGVGHRAQKSLTYGSATKNITTVFRLLGIKMKCYQNTSKIAFSDAFKQQWDNSNLMLLIF